MKLDICLKPLSPLCLTAGNADVNVDADIVRDIRGLPYFPARRLKGLLYESALEVVEMMELSGLDILDRGTVEELFGHVDKSPIKLILHDLHLEGNEEIENDWDYLLKKYKNILRPEDVLEAYSSLRSQTALEKTGVAKRHSLRTIRVMDAVENLTFLGQVQILHGEVRHKNAFILAMQNLSQAGANRNRGLGRVACSLRNEKEQRQIVEKIFEVRQ